MDSGRLQLSYHHAEEPDWADGLHHWLHRFDTPLRKLRRFWRQTCTAIANLPLRWAAIALLGLPALGLVGWIHEAGHARLTAVSPDLRRPVPASINRLLIPTVAPAQAEALHQQASSAASVAVAPEPTPAAVDWAPVRRYCELRPSDHLPVPSDATIRIRVVTVQARVTAYTPYDHAETHPTWADGIVAWYPNGRRRHVAKHRYGLATDWSQFPPGATFIRVPGYMSQTFSRFPENFRVVDDACGMARRTTREGGQPVIDVRYMTRYSAIDGRNAWGSKYLDVEVVYPADFEIPDSIRPWVVSEEWRTYDADGNRLDQ